PTRITPGHSRDQLDLIRRTIARRLQAFSQGPNASRRNRLGTRKEKTDLWNLAGLLRACRKRQRRRSAYDTEKIPPPHGSAPEAVNLNGTCTMLARGLFACVKGFTFGTVSGKIGKSNRIWADLGRGAIENRLILLRTL